MKYDLSKIKEELFDLLDINFMGIEWNQIYLQGKEKGIDPIEPTKGRMWKEIDEEELLWDVNLFDFPYINSILDERKLCRTRIMKTKPKSCYLWHKDPRKRLHIPITTNEHCFLLLEHDGRMHLPATGESYIVDTTQYHTQVNASREERIHIVGTFK
tara:strand:+ start:1553 stop:2023 length:471 start_codon:yes stop_codon:yes gene_type:complete